MIWVILMVLMWISLGILFYWLIRSGKATIKNPIKEIYQDLKQQNWVGKIVIIVGGGAITAAYVAYRIGYFTN
tara:strand:- start:560 stop:778 length:219 start_codon:yes stop_codon:yes gene_type:complete